MGEKGSSGGGGRRRAICEGSLFVALPPAAAFHLFTPEGERAWVADWEPEILSGGPGGLEAGAIFRTRAGGEAVIWTVLECDPDGGRLAYSRVSPEMRAGIVRVGLVAEGDGARVTVQYDMTALGEAGDRAVAAMDAAAFAAMMEDWQARIGRALGESEPG